MESNNKINAIFKSRIFLIIIMIFLIKPGSFTENPVWQFLDKICMYGRIFSFAYCIFMLVTNKVKIDKFFALLLLYYGTLALITYYKIGFSFELLVQFVTCCCWTALFDYHMQCNEERFISSLEVIFVTFAIINFITILFFPGGMYINSSGYRGNYFLGYDNNMITFLFPTIAITFMNSIRKYNKISIKSLIVFLICILSLIITWPATSIAAIFLFLILLIFSAHRMKKLKKTFTLTTLLLALFLIFILIFVFKLQESFNYLIVDILKKDITFTGRTDIWSLYLSLIAKSPFFGYGAIDAFSMIKMYNVGHAHDLYINILFQGGIVCLIEYLIMILYTSKKVDKCKGKQSQIIAYLIFAILFASIFEVYNTVGLMTVLYMLGIYSEKFNFLGGEKSENIDN